MALNNSKSDRKSKRFRPETKSANATVSADSGHDDHVRVTQSRRVCLLIDTSTSWGTRLIKGVSRHAQEAGDWLIHVEPWGRYERFRVPIGWDGHGIIARVNHQTLAEEIAASRLPAINLSWYPFSNERIR